MKYSLSISIFSLLLSSCINLNQSIVSDSSLDPIPYFQTYYISTNEELPEQLFNPMESAIHTKLQALGYEQTCENPDLYIFYDIYEDNFITLVPTNQNLDETDFNKKDKLKKLKLKHGSIYISLFNKEQEQVVWRGFSNGYSLNPRIVKAKAYEIMDQYDILAANENIVSAR